MQIQEVIENYKKLANDKQNTAEIFTIYVLLRAIAKGTPAEETVSRLKKSFTPVTNKNKLNNGRKPYDTLQQQVSQYAVIWHRKRYIAENGLTSLTEEEIAEIEEYANQIHQILTGYRIAVKTAA